MSDQQVAVEATSGSSTRRWRKAIVVGLAALVVAGGLAGVYFLVLDGGGDPERDAEPTVDASPSEGPIVEVGTLTTNLAGAAGRYARVGIALVLRADADAAVVEQRLALVKDAAIGEIGRHDVATLSGGDGPELLRKGLSDTIRELYPEGEVVRVVLTELLIQ